MIYLANVGNEGSAAPLPERTRRNAVISSGAAVEMGRALVCTLDFSGPASGVAGDRVAL
jgi:hypothetical protein